METKMISLSLIKPDPNQPRKNIDSDSIKNLSKSLNTEGLIHAIEIDKDNMIIVGELRYQAAKLLNWEEIKATVNPNPLTPYERLRRQMSENLQQSGAKGGGQPMNTIDTAKAWAMLYKLRVGKDYEPGSQSREDVYGKFKEIVEEVGVDRHTVWEYLKLLEEKEYVIDDLLKGRPRTYYREVEGAPEEIKDKLKKKIASGDYKSRDEIKRTVDLAKKSPDAAEVEIERPRAKTPASVNRIIDGVIELYVALEKQTLEQSDTRSKNMIIKQLTWLRDKIDEYLGKEYS
jgi:ParB family transcriptional regulator, chromosome partitioning protein